MKKLKREIRLLIVSILVGWALRITPADCIKTLNWFLSMPIEEPE